MLILINRYANQKQQEQVVHIVKTTRAGGSHS
jgi:hypothetical protein